MPCAHAVESPNDSELMFSDRGMLVAIKGNNIAGLLTLKVSVNVTKHCAILCESQKHQQ